MRGSDISRLSDGSRTIAVNLDGFDFDLARRLIADGELPALAALARDSRQFRLEHGSARRTGLAGEHYATGLAPEAMNRFAAVHFDPQSYDVWTETTSATPLVATLDVPNIAFDLTYFRLEDAPLTSGLTGWGAHDTGCRTMSRPAGLADEIRERFGPYPATAFIYGYVWPSIERSREMGERLAEAVERRGEVFSWLLEERLPDWRLAQLCVSEPHSVLEGLYHGVDPEHPLAEHPSATAARDGVLGVYRACDRLIGQLRDRFPDASLIVFSPHGMGPNESDLASMALLPELLHRREFGKPFLDTRACRGSEDVPPGLPSPVEPKSWEHSLRRGLEHRPMLERHYLRYRRWRARRRRDRRNRRVERGEEGGYASGLDWQPATAYQPFWGRMRAFALPSFYDGQLRLNVIGRESAGRVPPADYAASVERLRTFLLELIDPASGLPAVRDVEIDSRLDPWLIGPTQADLKVVWRGAPLAIAHPDTGTVGPLPPRRPGGHTGGHGMALVAALGVDDPTADDDDDASASSAADGCGLISGTPAPLRSAFDVAPTVLALAGRRAKDVSGLSLLS